MLISSMVSKTDVAEMPLNRNFRIGILKNVLYNLGVNLEQEIRPCELEP